MREVSWKRRLPIFFLLWAVALFMSKMKSACSEKWEFVCVESC